MTVNTVERGNSLENSKNGEKPKQSTIAVLDGVRAFACFAVICYHVNHLTVNHLWSSAQMGSILSNTLQSGFSGVTLFFILSGFLLFMTYARSLLFDEAWPQMKRFYLRRIFRILPGYYVSLVLMVLIFHREYLQFDHLGQLSLFFSFLMDATAQTYQKLNGPFWTLAIEWQFYMFLPLLALGLRWIVQRGSLRRRLTTLLVCLGVLILWGVSVRQWGSNWQQSPYQAAFLPVWLHNTLFFIFYGHSGKYLEDFSIGMIISVLYALFQYAPEHAISRFLPKGSRLFWFAGLLCLFFAVSWPFSSYTYVAWHLFGPHQGMAEVPYSLGYGLCVMGILFGARDLQWFWQLRPLRWLGMLSYGLYMWHLPLIFVFTSYIEPWMRSWNHMLVYSLIWLWVIAIAIPTSYVFHLLIEQPWIKIGSRLVGKKS
jgi:peptidoglycan/LPS O-acetylase OafA/YrhL